MGSHSSFYSCWEHTQSPHKGTQSISGFADSSWILLSDRPHIKSKEVFLAPTHNIPPEPKVTEVARRVTLHPGPEPHKQKPGHGGASGSPSSGGSRACVTAPLEGCATQPLSSHILSAARWAQIPLWEATDNFLLLARVAASLLLLFGSCFHSPLLLGNENPALNV